MGKICADSPGLCVNAGQAQGSAQNRGRMILPLLGRDMCLRLFARDHLQFRLIMVVMFPYRAHHKIGDKGHHQ